MQLKMILLGVAIESPHLTSVCSLSQDGFTQLSFSKHFKYVSSNFIPP